MGVYARRKVLRRRAGGRRRAGAGPRVFLVISAAAAGQRTVRTPARLHLHTRSLARHAALSTGCPDQDLALTKIIYKKRSGETSVGGGRHIQDTDIS